MLNSRALITVYIVTYNRESLVARAIESVLSQSYENIELIVVNDGSVDNTDLLLQKYADQGKIIYLKNERNIGACAARNLAINIAKGEYITGLDDDDTFTPERVEILFNAYVNGNYSCVGTGVEEIIDNHRVKRCQDSGIITIEKLLHYNALGNQVFTRTEFLKEIGGFDVSMPAMQDYDTWVRLVSKRGPAFKIKNYSYILNKHHGFDRISNNTVAMENAFFIFFSKYASEMNKKQLNSMEILRKKFKKDGYTLFEFIKLTNNQNFIYSLTLYINSNFQFLYKAKLFLQSIVSRLFK